MKTIKLLIKYWYILAGLIILILYFLFKDRPGINPFIKALEKKNRERLNQINEEIQRLKNAKKNDKDFTDVSNDNLVRDIKRGLID